MDLSEVKTLLVEQGKAITQWKTDLESRLGEVEKRVNRPAFYSSGAPGKSESPEQRKALDGAFRALIAGNQTQADRLLGEYKAMSVGSDPDGGYFVSTQVSDTMTKVMLETAPFIGLARTINLRQGDAFEEPLDRNQADASWVGETATRSDTNTPQIGVTHIDLNEIYACPSVTQKLVDTADINVVEWLSGKIAESFANKQSDAFFNGDGLKQPRGFLTYSTAATGDATRPWGTVEYVGTGTTGDFAASNPADTLFDTVTKLKAQYRAGAVWLMNRATLSKIRKFKEATTNAYLWQPGLQAGAPSTLLGYPVIECEEMPALSSGSLSVAFGNFQKAYTIIRRPGIKLLVDPYTNKPYVRLYAYERVGGGLVNTEAIKLIKAS